MLLTLESTQTMSSLQNVMCNLQDVIINCKLLDLQISDVIDYTNFKQSGIQMELEEFSIQEITNELFYLYGPQMNIKQLKMQIDYRMENDCNERLIIRNDKHRLKQVLISMPHHLLLPGSASIPLLPASFSYLGF